MDEIDEVKEVDENGDPVEVETDTDAEESADEEGTM